MLQVHQLQFKTKTRFYLSPFNKKKVIFVYSYCAW